MKQVSSLYCVHFCALHASLDMRFGVCLCSLLWLIYPFFKLHAKLHWQTAGNILGGMRGGCLAPDLIFFSLPSLVGIGLTDLPKSGGGEVSAPLFLQPNLFQMYKLFKATLIYVFFFQRDGITIFFALSGSSDVLNGVCLFVCLLLESFGTFWNFSEKVGEFEFWIELYLN